MPSSLYTPLVQLYHITPCIGTFVAFMLCCTYTFKPEQRDGGFYYSLELWCIWPNKGIESCYTNRTYYCQYTVHLSLTQWNNNFSIAVAVYIYIQVNTQFNTYFVNVLHVQEPPIVMTVNCISIPVHLSHADIIMRNYMELLRQSVCLGSVRNVWLSSLLICSIRQTLFVNTVPSLSISVFLALCFWAPPVSLPMIHFTTGIVIVYSNSRANDPTLQIIVARM